MNLPPRRHFTVVYVVKWLPPGYGDRMLHQIRTLRALGHRVEIIFRRDPCRNGSPWPVHASELPLHRVREDAPLLWVRGLLAFLPLLLRSARRGELPSSRAGSESAPLGFRRLLHAAMLASRVRRLRADHFHFVNERSRVARVASALAGIPYSFVARAQDAASRKDPRYMIVPAPGARQEIVELLIRLVESPDTEEGPPAPLALLVDPDPAYRTSLREPLAKAGLAVREATLIEPLIDGVPGEQPDLILATADGAGAEALRLLQRVRRDPKLQHVPFVLLASKDDRRVRLRALQEGADDVVSRADTEELMLRATNLLQRRTGIAPRRRDRRRRGVAGRLEDLPLPDIVQFLVLARKTACVTLSHENATGRIWFRGGSIVHARLGDTDGEQALFDMLRWPGGDFVIRTGMGTHRKTIQGDPMYLVMEGVRRADEQSGSAARGAAS